MDTPVSAPDANRSFSRLLREVRAGKSFVVTSHGKPVARIVPCGEAEEAERAKRREARSRWLEELRARPASEAPIGPWTRDELYERD